MRYTVTRLTAAARHLAVVRDRRAWSQLGGQLLPLLDRVYAAVKAGAIVQAGHNVFLYREPTSDRVTVEIGIEVAAPFDAAGEVVHSLTPAGDVVSTMHVGPYANLGRAYEVLDAWCREHQLKRAGVTWEVYGDWHEDPSRMETELFYLLETEQR